MGGSGVVIRVLDGEWINHRKHLPMQDNFVGASHVPCFSVDLLFSSEANAIGMSSQGKLLAKQAMALSELG